MLWTSLRFGWGNTGPLMLLVLLPLVTITTAVDRLPLRPQVAAETRLVLERNAIALAADAVAPSAD